MARSDALERASEKKTAVWRIMGSAVVPILHLIGKYVIIDGHKLPKTGAFVLAANHYTEFDPFVVGYAMWHLGRLPRFLAKAPLFKAPIVGAALRASGQIPVDRVGVQRGEPVAAAAHLAERNLAVIVYPEGSLTRDPDMWPMRGKTGAVRIALEAGVPVIPLAHWGAQKIMGRYARSISLFPRKKVLIKVGDPVDLSDFRGKPLDSASLAAATSRVMDAITALLEDLRGEKAPPERWDPAKHRQSEIGRF